MIGASFPACGRAGTPMSTANDFIFRQFVGPFIPFAASGPHKTYQDHFRSLDRVSKSLLHPRRMAVKAPTRDHRHPPRFPARPAAHCSRDTVRAFEPAHRGGGRRRRGPHRRPPTRFQNDARPCARRPLFPKDRFPWLPSTFPRRSLLRMTDPDLVSFGSNDGAGTPTAWSYLTPAGDGVLVTGTGMTFDAAGRPTGGTATSIEIDVGNDDPTNPELVITGISVAAATPRRRPGELLALPRRRRRDPRPRAGAGRRRAGCSACSATASRRATAPPAAGTSSTSGTATSSAAGDVMDVGSPAAGRDATTAAATTRCSASSANAVQIVSGDAGARLRGQPADRRQRQHPHPVDELGFVRGRRCRQVPGRRRRSLRGSSAATTT